MRKISIKVAGKGMVSETTIEEVAQNLTNKKSQKQSVGILLGHRASRLFPDNLYEALRSCTATSSELAKMLKRNSPTANDVSKVIQHIQLLNNLSATDRFKECYNILSMHFNESAIHDIFFRALLPPRYREEDKLMARLIKAGFFDTIITTSIDSLLEDACALLRMKKDVDYRVFMYGTDDSTVIGQSSGEGRQIIKVFGDFVSTRYNTVGKEFDLEGDQHLREFLISELAKEIIIIGYDPIWDRPVEWAFQKAGATLWYVNEEQLAQHTHLANILNQRDGRLLEGPQGSYASFLKALTDLIGSGMDLELEAGLSPLPPQSGSKTRTKVFISYSHKNKEYLERLQTHLKGYLLAEGGKGSIDLRVVIWDDTKIPLGADWDKEIKEALVQAKIAVLLVSADFLASDYISDHELPILLDAAKNGEARLLSVVVGPCAFRHTPLARYQVMNPPSQPVMGMTSNDQEVVWAQLAEQIYTILNSEK